MDSLSTAISLIRTINIIDPELYKYVSRLVCLDISAHKDFELLIKDPQSLCTHYSEPDTEYSKKSPHANLPIIIQNPDISPLFSVTTDIENTNLINDLMTMTPFNPQLAHFIYSASNPAKRDQIIGRIIFLC